MENLKELLASTPIRKSKKCSILQEASYPQIIKWYLSSKSLKGTPKLRVIFAYYEDIAKVEFIEIYSKSNKQREDTKRYNAYLAEHGSMPDN